MKKESFKFSVVVPVYNVEEYLEETIESIINQDIGFKKNIQLILVNDGSLDNSEEICLKYRNMFPDNIIYIKQENLGVSAARNNGMNFVEGKYVNFLDGDDKWELSAFSKVWDFFNENEKKIKVLSCRMKFFEDRDDYHILDYKFVNDRIINILEYYDCIQLHITSTFLKSDIIKKYKFNTKLKYGEDTEFLTSILLDYKSYGLLRSVTHFYRKRKNQTSAVQNKEKNIEWYTDTIDLFYKKMIHLSIDKFNEVIPYIQYLLAYDIQWRIAQQIPEEFPVDVKNAYKKSIIEILRCIEDYIICEQRKMHSEYKVYALSLKYGRDIREEIVLRKDKFYFNNIPIYNLRNKSFFRITMCEIEKGFLKMEGQVNIFLKTNQYNIYFKSNTGERYKLQYYDICNYDREGLDGVIYKNLGFVLKIPLNKKMSELKVMFAYKNKDYRNLDIKFGKFSKISEDIPNSFYSKEKYAIKTFKNKIYIQRSNKKTRRALERKYLKDLLLNKEYKIVFYRIIYRIAKKLNKREIWIVSDRTNKAGDNGESLFKYLVKHEKKAEVYFAIDKCSKDYKRMKKIGKVLKYNSVKYKLKFLQSSKIISSQANDYVFNAFGEKIDYIKDLYNFKFVFLQHGITKDDLSTWLYKQNKNISLFVTSSQREWESIVEGLYNYSKNEVKLTGLPRYDYLTDNRKEKIIIMPTWRTSILPKSDNKNGIHEYSEYFKETDYCKFYNRLINDERLLNCIESKGYTACFFLHPTLSSYKKDFKSNKIINVESEANYQKEFSEAKLLVTDYSSVAFDFAYLRKPVIYTQFDSDTFFEGQMYDKGYFNYEKDGFGPVCYDYESTVETIINFINNNCNLEKEYVDRINSFYQYEDKNNCERVYKEILKL